MRKNPISKSEIEIIKTIIKDIKSGRLITNHPLQRYSDMWSKEQQGNLIRRVLHDGRFLPILICTQYDEHGCEVRYLIDGVQRMTTFEAYMNDEFAISKNTIDYMIDYDGILYEKKDLASGKFALKRDRNKKLIPILDENGNTQRRVQSIDVRGLKYSELPPELQDKINNYKVSVELKLECSDEDIQVEILDYNSGTKMNDAQIGKNRLGAEFARIVIELSNHSFIKNKCGFTPDNFKKGVIDRAINEALMLVNFGAENWVTSHKDLCRKLSNWITTEHTDKMREMFDELDEIIPELNRDVPEEKEILDYLTLKEFFVVMANYHYFRDCGYKSECYTQFLREFITETSYIKNIPTGEVDENGEDIFDSFRNVYMQGSKQKGNIESRLDVMNSMLDEYLAENCGDMTEDEAVDEVAETEIDINKVSNFVSDFIETGVPFNTKSTALKTLMQFASNYPTRDYTPTGVENFEQWLKDNTINEESADDCLISATMLRDYLNNAGAADKFSENDIAILIRHVFSYGEELDEDIFETWLEDYNNVNNCEQSGESAAVLEKDSFLRESYSNFLKYIINNEGDEIK